MQIRVTFILGDTSVLLKLLIWLIIFLLGNYQFFIKDNHKFFTRDKTRSRDVPSVDYTDPFGNVTKIRLTGD